jgi:hypothetical protein
LRPSLFLSTTSLGVVPTVAIYTFFFAALARAAASHHGNVYAEISAQLPRLAVPLGLLLLVTLVPQWLRARRRKQRLAVLREARRQREADRRQTPTSAPGL